MAETFGSTCHGAGRALSRNKSRNNLGYEHVLQKLADGIISPSSCAPPTEFWAQDYTHTKHMPTCLSHLCLHVTHGRVLYFVAPSAP